MVNGILASDRERFIVLGILLENLGIDEDTTYTVGGNCSQVDSDRRTERMEPRSYSSDASVDHTEAHCAHLKEIISR